MGFIVQGMATAGIDGHKNIAAPSAARAGLHNDQPEDSRFSDLLTAPDAHAPAAPAQAQTQTQKSAKTDSASAKTQTHSGKSAAAPSDKQMSAATDHSDNARAEETADAATQDETGPRIQTEHADTDRNHKTDATDDGGSTANAQGGDAVPPVEVKDTDTKDTGTKGADKKADDGKKAGPRQAQNGNSVPSPMPGTIPAANAAAGQAVPQTNTATTDKNGGSHAASANAANISGVAATGTGTLIAAARLAPAAGRDPRGSGKTDPARSPDKAASAQKDAQDTTAATGSTAANTANKPATDMQAIPAGKTSSHSKAGGNAQNMNADTAPAQNTPAPAGPPAQQSAQNNSQAPAPTGSLTMQGMTPDPSTLGAGSAGMGGHILIAAAQGTAASTGAATGGAGPLPQTLQINQMPPLLPNMAQLGIAITTRALAGSRQFDIRLDPPELGRVDVRLSIDSTGKAQAHLSADQQQTLELLQKDSSGLARALRDAGLNVAQNGLNFSLRQHSGGGTNHGGFSPRGARALALSAVASLASAPSIPPLGALSQSLSGPGRLDISV